MVPIIIIEKQSEKREGYALNFLKELGFNKNHPDLMWLGPEEKLGIEQARQIKDFLHLKPYQAQGQAVIIISAQNLTIGAQNALLKILEEHSQEVNILLGTENEDLLLPTIISRCKVINLNLQKNSTCLDACLPVCRQARPAGQGRQASEVEQKFQKEIKELLKLDTEERFLFVEKVKEKEEFLYALTFFFRKNFINHPWGVNLSPPLGCKVLKDLLLAEKWAKQNVNIRAILEYLMLSLPKIN